jgi:hypothetical protein
MVYHETESDSNALKFGGAILNAIIVVAVICVVTVVLVVLFICNCMKVVNFAKLTFSLSMDGLFFHLVYCYLLWDGYGWNFYYVHTH